MIHRDKVSFRPTLKKRGKEKTERKTTAFTSAPTCLGARFVQTRSVFRSVDNIAAWNHLRVQGSGAAPWCTTQPPVASTSFPLKGALLEASSEGFKITSNTAASDTNSHTHTHAQSLQWYQMLQTFACSRQFPWSWAKVVASSIVAHSFLLTSREAQRPCGRPLEETTLGLIQLALSAHVSTAHTYILQREASWVHYSMSVCSQELLS